MSTKGYNVDHFAVGQELKWARTDGLQKRIYLLRHKATISIDPPPPLSIAFSQLHSVFRLASYLHLVILI